MTPPSNATAPDPTADDSEAAYLASYRPGDFPPFSVTADVVLLTIDRQELSVLLVRRGGHPHKGKLALPGGFVEHDETLEAAALRELNEETGLDLHPRHIEQLGTYGDPYRDPRMRIVTVAYVAFMPKLDRVAVAGSDAAAVDYYPVSALGGETGLPLAFDHERIIADAVERARGKLEYTTLATAFVDHPFTLPQLRRVYEAVWGAPLHPSNFNRAVLATPGFVTPTRKKAKDTGGGHARLYMPGPATRTTTVINRPGATAR